MFKVVRRLATAAVASGIIAGSLALATPAIASPVDFATSTPRSTSTYSLSVNGQTTTLTEGQAATYALHLINPPTAPNAVSPNAVYTGDAGVLTVTASAGSFHYSIAMSVPATTFVGFFGVTDLTSGLSGGLTPEGAFTGSAPTSRLHGHRYSGNLSGTAFFLGAPVATTMPNNTLYTYP